ncbi:LOW QUALITY PROTEIN: hypothetical protein OSB04_028745, partial [Centaurea solstitialis]
MKFNCGGKSVTIRGDPSLGRLMVSLKSIGRVIDQKGHWILIELGACDMMQEGNELEDKGMESMLEEFDEVFNMPSGLPPEKGREHGIVLKEGAGAINVRPYRYPHYQKDKIEWLVKEMLEVGLIQPSLSPFSSLVLLVKKKDGSWRFCVDYRALNRTTVVDKFPIPVIEELLDELHGATIFSKLDLKSGYHQIRMKEKDIQKTAFRTHQGLYEFLVMPFGLTNAPATFQALMNEVFKQFLRKFVLVFFDDILVYSHLIDEHKEHLKKVLEVLKMHQLYANKKKCEFGRDRLGYLGHLISSKEMEVDPSKIRAVMDWTTPKTITELRGFLGLSGYYRKFIRNYGVLARPLTDLLKKNQFMWSEEAQSTFDKLKLVLASAPVLRLPDFSKEFVLETDASGYGLGAVLMQEEQPIAFFSHALGSRAQQKSVYEKELMAIVFAIKKWRPYLLGRRFVVRPDQQSLRFLLEQRVVEPDYQRWMSKLMGYDFTVVYKPGRVNQAADALSRKLWVNRHWNDLKKEIDDDVFLKQIKADLSSGRGFEVRQGMLFYNDRLVIPKNSTFIPSLFYEFHSSRIGGHTGEDRTYQRLAAEVFWMGMKKDIIDMVKKCDTCQRNKILNGTPVGLLQPLELPEKVWDEVSMDFVKGLPRSYGRSTIMVVVDRVSKYAHFVGLKHPFNAQTVAAAFSNEIIRLHGVPQSVVFDRDKIFKELFQLQGSKLKYSSTYHPQSDGQTEVVNRCLEQYLRCWVSGKPRQWFKWLPWAELSYNTSYHTSLKSSPFKVLYGREPPPLLRYKVSSAKVQSVEHELLDRDMMLDEIKMNLLKAQFRMKQQTDLSRKDVSFKSGEWAFLKLRPYRRKSLVMGNNPILLARFYGPYRVLEQIEKVAYRLDLSDTARIHPVFHVSQLRKAVGNYSVSPYFPPQISEDLVLQAIHEDVLDIRRLSNGDVGQFEVLVKWEGMSEFEASWENLDALLHQFPHNHLEDKVKLWGRGVLINLLFGSLIEGVYE